MPRIPEKDWKQLRALEDVMLKTACDRVFEKIEKISKARKGNEHESYLKVWKLIQKEDDEISIMFDDLRRSNALMKLAAWRRNRLLSDQELAQFTAKTQYEIFDYYGKIQSKGEAIKVDVSALKNGTFFINYDNKTETFIKR